MLYSLQDTESYWKPFCYLKSLYNRLIYFICIIYIFVYSFRIMILALYQKMNTVSNYLEHFSLFMNLTFPVFHILFEQFLRNFKQLLYISFLHSYLNCFPENQCDFSKRFHQEDIRAYGVALCRQTAVRAQYKLQQNTDYCNLLIKYWRRQTFF